MTSRAKEERTAAQTLRRAREELRVVTRREGIVGSKQRFYWSLPENDSGQSNPQLQLAKFLFEHNRRIRLIPHKFTTS
jgi:hypothetical protein